VYKIYEKIKSNIKNIQKLKISVFQAEIAEIVNQNVQGKLLDSHLQWNEKYFKTMWTKIMYVLLSNIGTTSGREESKAF